MAKYVPKPGDFFQVDGKERKFANSVTMMGGQEFRKNIEIEKNNAFRGDILYCLWANEIEVVVAAYGYCPSGSPIIKRRLLRIDDFEFRPADPVTLRALDINCEEVVNKYKAFTDPYERAVDAVYSQQTNPEDLGWVTEMITASFNSKQGTKK